MGRVLVDEDEPVGSLGQDVGLGQGAQDGQVLKAKVARAGVGNGARGQGPVQSTRPSAAAPPPATVLGGEQVRERGFRRPGGGLRLPGHPVPGALPVQGPQALAQGRQEKRVDLARTRESEFRFWRDGR